MATKSSVDNPTGTPRSLSSRVTSMKFMRRKEQSDLRDRISSDQCKALQKSQWVLLPDVIEKSNSIPRPSTAPSPAFVPARRSFNKFNPAVESARKVCQDASLEHSSERETISDREMASRYQTLIGGQHTQKHNLERTSTSKSKKAKTEPKNSEPSNQFLKPKPL